MGLFGSLGLDFSSNKSRSTTNSSSNTATSNTRNATTNGTFSNTSTSTLPDWALNPVQGATGRVGGLLNLNPTDLVAPAHALQTRAAQEAGGLNDSSWTFEAANGLLARAAAAQPNPHAAETYAGAQIAPTSNAQAGSLLQNLDAYMSPYRQQVVDAALGDFEHGAGQTRAQLDLDLAGAGAFGGSGAALTKSMTEGELARGRATTSANLLDQMFNRGAQLSNLDADRRTQVSMANSQAMNTAGLSQAQLAQQAGLARADALNAASQFNGNQQAAYLDRQINLAQAAGGLAETYGRNQRANIETQANVGGMMRGIDNEIRQAPITTNEQIVAMLSGLPLGLFGIQNQQGTSAETQASTETGTEATSGTSATRGKNTSVGVSAKLGFEEG